MMLYKDIVFLQNPSDTEEPERILEEGGLIALFTYLKQWEDGSEVVQQWEDGAPWGTSDDVYRYDGGYVMTISRGMPYYGLVKIVTEVEA